MFRSGCCMRTFVCKFLCVTRFPGPHGSNCAYFPSCNGDKAPEDPCIKQCEEVNGDSFQRALSFPYVETAPSSYPSQYIPPTEPSF